MAERKDLDKINQQDDTKAELEHEKASNARSRDKKTLRVGGYSVLACLIVLAICSLLSIYFIRPVALRYLHRNDENRVSNADALMGRIGHVSQTIEAGDYGRVAIDGDDWKAVAANGERIEKGEKVKVVGRESIIITVEKVENQ